jgi:8-oxo-dGTP diphosphatase
LKVRAKLQNYPTMIAVAAAALIATDGRVLMHQRPFAKQHGGLWEFPGGKLEPHENARTALARELTEELGIAIEPAAFFPVAQAADPDGGLTIELFACREWRGDPQCLEGEAIGWFVPEALAGLAMPPLDVPLAHALIEALRAAI